MTDPGPFETWLQAPAAISAPSIPVMFARASHEQALRTLDEAARQMAILQQRCRDSEKRAEMLARQLATLTADRDAAIANRDQTIAFWRAKVAHAEDASRAAEREAQMAARRAGEAKAREATAIKQAETAQARAEAAEDYAARLKLAVVEEFSGLRMPAER